MEKKEKVFGMRLSEQDMKKLETLSQATGISISGIIRAGIDMVYHSMEQKGVTYGDIYQAFLEDTGFQVKVKDYRPAQPPYCETIIPNTIKVWLESGAVILYTIKGE